MVFSGETFGAELVAVVVAGDSVVGSVLDEQLEIDSATHAVSPAMAQRMRCAETTSPDARGWHLFRLEDQHCRHHRLDYV
jgi:hypothetical protein